MVDHLPILELAGYREWRDSSVVGRIDVRLVVYKEVHYFLVSVLYCQMDGSIPILK